MVVLRESLDGMPMLSSIAYPVVQRHYRLAKDGMLFPGKDTVRNGKREPTTVLIRPVEVLGTVAVERFYINRGTDILIEENKRLLDLFDYADGLTERVEKTLEDDEDSELARLRKERLAKLQGRKGFR